MFENYLKKRSQLPEAYVSLYEEHYKTNREEQIKASGLAQKMGTWLHKKVVAE